MLRRWRLTGVMYVVLVMIVTAAAIVLTKAAKLSVAGTVVAILPTIAPLFLAWRAFREDRSDLEQAVGVEDLLVQLAVAVQGQWAAEIGLRGADDPYPLPVSWRPAAAGLFDGTVEYRSNSNGQFNLEALLSASQSRRLVVLGDPGSGKTILLVRMLLGLVDTRDPGQPVPLLLPLASWDPLRLNFTSWIRQRLEIEHPSLLLDAPPAFGHGVIRSQVLLDRRLIMPLLDGLDELPVAVRARALQEINASLGKYPGLVLSSRAAEFLGAARPPSARSIKLRDSVGIELIALEPEEVERYLLRDADDAYLARRWSPVLAELRRPGPLRSAFETPLIVTLARTIYNPRPGERLDNWPDPRELCDRRWFSSRRAIEQHLFDGYVRVAYRPGGTEQVAPGPRWGPAGAARWLRFLAHHLETNEGGTPDLRWWNLSDAMSRRGLGLMAFGALTGLAIMLLMPLSVFVGVPATPLVGVSVVLGAGAAIVSLVRSALRPARGLRWAKELTVRAGVLGSTAGLQASAGLGALAYVQTNSLIAGLIFGTLGLLSGVFFTLIIGMKLAPADLSATPTPGASVREDRGAFVVNTLLFGTALGLILGVVLGLIMGVVAQVPRLEYAGRPDLIHVRETPPAVDPVVASCWAYVGLVTGLGIGLTISLARSAWGVYLLTRYYLAITGRLPWRLLPFLSEAHQRRGVLRQAGPIYQFRHIELQRRLAARYENP
ncbi:NACHT domain-containing protein [Actinoplanes subglobosus]|uniref:NACHT domain-containing protein n=1 Tax=Actinoplanes subglobosus TaxID=1547892 RepID=A0ABV8IPM0_9ACTN